MFTTNNIRALRTCDTVCFDLRLDADGQPHGYIRAITYGTGDNYYADETTVTLKADHCRVENYGPAMREDQTMTGYVHVGSAQYTPHVRTALLDIKRESKVGLVWTRHNDSPLLREHGLVCDMLDLVVQNGTTEQKVRTYRIEKQVGLDNTARMIQYRPIMEPLYWARV